MKIVTNTPEKLVARFASNHSLANALRRSVDAIQTLAIDEVEFFKNDSALYDEYLSHRLGLIPLKTDSKMGASTSIDLKLSKSGPCTVYSGDFKGSAKIVYDKIPITLLEKGQDIELVATAKLGTGIEHAKHIPGLCYYRHVLEVNSDPQIDKIVQGSKGEIVPEKKGGKWICDITDADIDKINDINGEAVKDGDEILFIVESFGLLDSDAILKKSCEVLVKNLEEFEKAIK
jgi:DNA-directed RNA polymerase subunit D